eukprot:699950-Ditylum_brightwellii.AAC.1
MVQYQEKLALMNCHVIVMLVYDRWKIHCTNRLRKGNLMMFFWRKCTACIHIRTELVGSW